MEVHVSLVCYIALGDIPCPGLRESRYTEAVCDMARPGWDGVSIYRDVRYEDASETNGIFQQAPIQQISQVWDLIVCWTVDIEAGWLVCFLVYSLLIEFSV